MKIIGMMVCGKGEAERYLEGSLKELKRLCDDAIIATNNADALTKQTIKKYGFWQYEDNREWGKEQPNIKTDLLKKVGKLNPDWIIAIDADEKFAPEFTRAEAERLGSGDEIAWYFLVVNLYNDSEHYAHGAGIQRFWNVRYFKYLPEYGLEYQKKALHCGLAPPVAYRYAWHAPYYLEHYGLMKPEDRQRKVERYQTYDPTAKYKSSEYYEDLAKDLPPLLFERSKLLEQLAVLPDCQPRKTPKLSL